MDACNDFGFQSFIYINNGSSLVEDSAWGENLIPVYESSAILGDVNNDYNIDLIMCGDEGTSNEITNVYLNNGTSFIENDSWQQNLLDVDWCSLSFADYDNDGDLDLIATGNEGYTTLYLYNSSGDDNFAHYSDDPETQILNLEKGSSVCFADIDIDFDLDLTLFGWYQGDNLKKAKVYINNITTTNTQSNPPTNNFYSDYSDEKMTLSWGSGSDTETPTLGLYYNLRAGTCSGCHDIVSGVYGGSSNPTAGYFGNMMQRKSITLNRQFEPGTEIYWAVQTIDTGLAKSAWSTEQVYVIPGNESGNESNCTPSWSCESWGACQPSNIQTCSSWADANNCNETYNGSDTISCTYDDGSSNGNSPSGSSSPSYTHPIIQHTFDSIEPYVPASKELADGVSVTVSVKKTISNVDMEASIVTERPTSITKEAKGNVYRYIEINASGIGDSDIDSASIEFNVTTKWIKGSNIDLGTVTLHRYHSEEWDALETGLVSSDDDFYHYSATTPGFSYFVITGEVLDSVEDNETAAPSLLCTPGELRCSGKELQECSQFGTVWLAKQICEVECDAEVGCIEVTPIDVPWLYIIVAVGIGGAAVLAFYIKRKKKKPPATLDDALDNVHTV